MLNSPVFSPFISFRAPAEMRGAFLLAISLTMLQCADAIYLLDGWRGSAGARAEYALAEKLGIEVLFQELKPEQCLYRRSK